VNVVEFDFPIREAVDAPRLHHQWLPDVVRLEPGLETEHGGTLAALRALGHIFAARPTVQGDSHSIWIDPATGEIVAAADKRISGDAAGY
jgi:gamma-glutamyltranspeptidase/glutathione hydrolase